MLKKYHNQRNVIEFVSLDAMVPEDHLLRKIDATINFDRIYDFVKYLYCEDNGRPSVYLEYYLRLFSFNIFTEFHLCVAL